MRLRFTRAVKAAFFSSFIASSIIASGNAELEDGISYIRGGLSRDLTSSSTCNMASYLPIDYNGATLATIVWSGSGGSDTEWLNVNNWSSDTLPGIDRYNRLILAAGDVATVHCPATYMTQKVYLEVRSSAKIDVTADLPIGDELVLKSPAELTQSGSSTVTVGARLFLASLYDMSEGAQLVAEKNMYMPTTGKLTLRGDGASVSVATKSSLTSEYHGILTYVLGPSGAGSVTVNGPLLISSWARLVVDASEYDGSAVATTATVPLIECTGGITGFVPPANIDITGLAAGLTSQVLSDGNGVYLVVSQGGPTPVAVPTPAPSTDVPTPVPTAVPTGRPTSNPTPVPTTPAPVPPGPTPVPTTSAPVPAPTAEVPTPAPTFECNADVDCDDGNECTIDACLGGTCHNDGNACTADEMCANRQCIAVGSTTVIALGASGVDSIVSDCPAQDTNALIIDGSAYTAGPGTVPLYRCASGVGFDPMTIELQHFPEGLWFEIVTNNGGVDLFIKSLTDYSEYFRGHSYNGEYPFQTSNDHFPGFSWDTVPKWINFRKNTPFTQDEVESIANNNYISWYGVVKPQEVFEMAGRIKAINPNHKMIYYFNSYGYWGDPIDTFNEDWLKYTVNANGERVYTKDKSGNRRLFNHSIPEMREWWVEHALYMNAHPDIAGVFADATRSPPDTLHSQMIAQLADRLPRGSIKMGNFLRQRDPNGNRWRMDYEDGSYLENVHIGPINQPQGQSVVVSMQLAREALWKNKLVLWNGSPMNCDNCGVTQADMSEYIKPTLAEFLMVTEEHAYYNFNVSPSADKERWMWDTSSMDEFKRPLGEPLGPPIKVGQVFTRHFEHVTAMLDPLAHTGTLDWKDVGDSDVY